jgi:hypothetical protein
VLRSPSTILRVRDPERAGLDFARFSRRKVTEPPIQPARNLVGQAM